MVNGAWAELEPIVVTFTDVAAARTTDVLTALPTNKAPSTAKPAIVSHTVLIITQNPDPWVDRKVQSDSGG